MVQPSNSTSGLPGGKLPPGLAQLVALIDIARRDVPAVNYAMGLVGIAAAGAAISLLLGQSRAAVIIGLMLGGMLVLFVVSVAVRKKASKSTKLAAETLVWVIVLLFAVSLSFTLTAVTFGWPPALVPIILSGNYGQNVTDDIAKLYSSSDPNDCQSSVNGLVELTRHDINQHNAVVGAISTALRRTISEERECRSIEIAALVKLSDYDLARVLPHGLPNSDLVDVDFSSTRLHGISFSGAFLILSDFRRADLSGAKLTNTFLRGVKFNGAIFEHADLTGADWFNAFGLDKSQLASAVGTLTKCPHGVGTQVTEFTKYNDANYEVPFQHYDDSYKNEAIENWNCYAAPGGLCEYVASLG
jgi:hypothetical protein